MDVMDVPNGIILMLWTQFTFTESFTPELNLNLHRKFFVAIFLQDFETLSIRYKAISPTRQELEFCKTDSKATTSPEFRRSIKIKSKLLLKLPY